jgi:hypothetical protein
MITVAGTVSGNTPESNTYPTAAGQTFLRGAPVKLDASGNVIVAAAGTDLLLGVSQHDAQADFTGGQDVAPVAKVCMVAMANDDTLFAVRLLAATAAAAADIGKKGLLTLVSGDWRLDPAGASGTFSIVRFGERTTVGKTGAQGANYICKIVAAGRLGA